MVDIERAHKGRMAMLRAIFGGGEQPLPAKPPAASQILTAIRAAAGATKPGPQK